MMSAMRNGCGAEVSSNETTGDAAARSADVWSGNVQGGNVRFGGGIRLATVLFTTVLLQTGFGALPDRAEAQENFCSLTPLVGCKTARDGRSSVMIRDRAKNKADYIKWSWTGADEVLPQEVPPPFDPNTLMTLCVYDARGGEELISETIVPTGPNTCGPKDKDCWRLKSDRKFFYRDTSRSSAGIDTVELTAGSAGRSRARFIARGENMSTFPLPMTAPLTFQIVLDDTVNVFCAEAVFSADGVRRNTSELFKAIGPTPAK